MEQAKHNGILAAAARAFQSFGFKKASIDEIARAAGVAKGTIYLACQSKEDLFYQVLHREIRAWAADVAKILDPRVPAEELLERASRASIEYLDRHPLVRALLFGEYHALLPAWTERFDHLVAIGRETVVEILRIGQRQGRFRTELDLEETAQILLDLQTAYYILHDRGPDKVARRERRAKAAFDVVIRGLQVRPEAG